MALVIFFFTLFVILGLEDSLEWVQEVACQKIPHKRAVKAPININN